jgi:hypothetical protein
MSRLNEVRVSCINEAESVLKGKKIVKVDYMYDKDLEALGWYHKALVIFLDDGTLIFPTTDDEGNDAGAIHYITSDDKSGILPVI